VPDQDRSLCATLAATAATVLELLIAGCAAPHVPAVPPAPSAAPEGLLPERLFSADNALFTPWTLIPIHGTGDWQVVVEPDGMSIRGHAAHSASAAMLAVNIDPVTCPLLEWQWLTESVQPSADLHTRAGDDVAAGLFVLFGDPGPPTHPHRVPTLRYVWAAHDQVGDVIDNPYLPGTVRNIVVHSGDADVGRWITERRNVLEDYIAAFGKPPEQAIAAVALFVDNDQTGEPAAVRYREATAYCSDSF